MSAIFADSGQGITSLPSKIMSCVSIQVSADYVSILLAPSRGAVVGLFTAVACLRFFVVCLVITPEFCIVYSTFIWEGD